jgi:hypothetical protein
MLIADALGIRTFDVETSKGWRDSRFQDKNRFTRAFLSVGSREEGTDLIARIGQIGDLGLVAEWKHDSEPELLRTSNVIVLGDRFPGLRGFYHAKFHLWRIEDINTGAEIRGVTATSATTYRADTAAEESETEGSFPVLGLVQVSRLLPPVFLDPDTLD